MHGDAYRLAELHGAVMPLMRRRHLSTGAFRPLSYHSFTLFIPLTPCYHTPQNDLRSNN
jgi:hypothetical protein